MGGIDLEPLRLLGRCFADGLERGWAFERLEALGEIVRVQEGLEMSARRSWLSS